MEFHIYLVNDQRNHGCDINAIFNKLNTCDIKVQEHSGLDNESIDFPNSIVCMICTQMTQAKADQLLRIKQQNKSVSIILFTSLEDLDKDTFLCSDKADYLEMLPLTSDKMISALEFVMQKKQVENRLLDVNSKLQDITSAYQVFVSAGRFMASSLLVQDVLTRIMEAVGSLLHAEAWSVAIQDEQTDELVFRAAHGVAKEQIIGAKVPRDKSIIGWVFDKGKPLIVKDTSKDRRHFKAFDRTSGFLSKSILCMPLKTKDKTIGAIEFINKVDSEFAAQDIDRVQVILDLAAITLENAKIFETLNALVEIDELTGLYNQESLVKRLEKLIELSRQRKEVFGYIFLDIDFLKKVNDKYGHLSGRAVLREVGQLLSQQINTEALIGRYGGDEFWVVLPGADETDTMKIAEKIRKTIEKRVFLKTQDLQIRLTASLGVVIYPNHADSFDEMAYLADKALFKAKQRNRNNVVCALDVM